MHRHRHLHVFTAIVAAPRSSQEPFRASTRSRRYARRVFCDTSARPRNFSSVSTVFVNMTNNGPGFARERHSRSSSAAYGVHTETCCANNDCPASAIARETSCRSDTSNSGAVAVDSRRLRRTVTGNREQRRGAFSSETVTATSRTTRINLQYRLFERSTWVPRCLLDSALNS
jgi:hypothetical protein